MSLRIAFSAASLLVAAPAVAQPPAAASSPPAAAPAAPAPSEATTAAAAAIQPAAMAFSQCLQGGVPNVAASLTPEAGATSVLSACAAQRAGLDRAVEALLVTLPAEQQTQGRTQYQSQLAQAQTQIADAIRAQRAAPAAPATPAPATPH